MLFCQVYQLRSAIHSQTISFSQSTLSSNFQPFRFFLMIFPYLILILILIQIQIISYYYITAFSFLPMRQFNLQALSYLLFKSRETKITLMNQYPINSRPFSPVNIRYSSPLQSRQNPSYACSSSNNYQHIYNNSQPIFHLNYGSPQPIVEKSQQPLVYSPVIAKPRNVNSSNKNIQIPISYNSRNIYYNRPLNDHSRDSSQNNSNQKYGPTRREIGSPSPRIIKGQKQVLVKQPTYLRPVSPPVSRPQIISHRIDERLYTPTIVIVPPASTTPPNNYKAQIEPVLNSKPTAFTMGQPKKPEILIKKKPGIKRLNSVNSQNSDGQRQSTKNDQTSNNNALLDHKRQSMEEKQQKNQMYSINPKPKPGNKQKTEDLLQFFQQRKPKRYYSSSEGQTTVSNNTQLFSQAENQYHLNVIDQVNITPIKNSPMHQTNDYGEGLVTQKQGHDNKIAKKNEHVYEQEHRIAEILVQELKLNYDYFNKVEVTDRSISDHVNL